MKKSKKIHGDAGAPRVFGQRPERDRTNEVWHHPGRYHFEDAAIAALRAQDVARPEIQHHQYALERWDDYAQSIEEYGPLSDHQHAEADDLVRIRRDDDRRAGRCGCHLSHG